MIRTIQRATAPAILYALASGACNPDGLRPPDKGFEDSDAGTSMGFGGRDSAGSTGSTAGEPTGSGSTGSMVNPGAGGRTGPPPTTEENTALLPARIRRLSNAEYDSSVASLLGASERPASTFAPDARQAGFSTNDAQRVDPVLAKQLFAAAETLAAEARPRIGTLAPCATPADPESCARAFIASFGGKAYRRPLVEEEASGLLDVYRVGADGDTYEGGIELVIRAVLQSAGFLYLTELGSGTEAEPGVIALTPHEVASSLSYLISASPPDQELMQAADSGALETAEGRVQQVARLRRQYPDASNERLVRAVREWLELDRIEKTAKDSTVYPAFDGVKDSFVRESQEFIEAVLNPASARRVSDVTTLLAADWTVAEQGLATLYDGTDMGGGRLSLRSRRGILNQGAFLSVKAHAHESTPVLRGVLIARRIACINIPSPSTLNIDVVPPVPDPTQTTRERFAVHTADEQCAQCHKTIDGFGNAFEQYDGMGQFRDTENGKPVDSTTSVDLAKDFAGSYADSNELAEALSTSAVVRECFARNLFRLAAARSDYTVTDSEDAFIGEWKNLSEIEQGNVMDTLLTFVTSRLFTHRRSQ